MKFRGPPYLMALVAVTLVYFNLYICNADESTDKEKEVELSKRQEMERNALIAARSVVLTQKMYPSRPKFVKALTRYSEIPYPLLIGPSIFFLSLFLVLVGYYIRKLVSKLLKRTAQLVDLYPETPSFPQVKLYNLQQSKREARLRHEARNTWAWMANKYLLMPHDPNVKTTTLSTTWSDFDIPKDVWSIVRAVMKVNGLFQHLKKGGKNNLDRNPKAVKKSTPEQQQIDRLNQKLKLLTLNSAKEKVRESAQVTPTAVEKDRDVTPAANDEAIVSASTSTIPVLK